MRIETVNVLGLDILYELCCVKQNSDNSFNTSSLILKNMNTLLSNKVEDIYNHTEISFALASVSMYEAFILKKFASNVSKLIDTHFMYKEYLPMDTPYEVRKYSEIMETIKDDAGLHNIIKYTYPYLYGPAYLIQGDMVCTFTGKELYQFFGKNPVEFFTSMTNGSCIKADEPDENGETKIKLDPNYKIDNFTVTQYIQKLFTNKFYAYLNNEVKFSDMIVDSVTYKNYSSHDRLYKLVRVRNPFLELDLKSSSKEDIINKTTNYRTKVQKEYKDQVLNLTRVDVSIYSNFSTFLELFENLPNEMFTYREDLKIPFKFKEIYIPKEFEPYFDKLEDRYTHLQEYIKSLDDNVMAQSQYTYLNSKYSYTLSFTLNEVNLFINPLLKNKGLRKESIDVITGLIKQAQNAYNLL